jgi:hypothetical protein
VKALENFGGLHGHDYAGAVVDRSGAEIPGIEMAGDYYDLFGMLGTSEVGDYVVAGFVGKFLGSQSEMHADLPFSGEMDDQVSIFGGDGRGGDSGWEVESSVREAIIGVAYGADQGGYCAQIGGGFGAGSAIADCLAVSSESKSSSSLLLVEQLIEKNDLASDFVTTECLEFFESVNSNYVCG